jgi:hypothetical protein
VSLHSLPTGASAPAPSSVIPPLPPIRRSRRPAKQRPDGRYRNDGGARLPANGLASSKSARNVPTTVASVPDPYAPKERIAVSVNRKTDILEWEHSHGHLSEAAYRTGRQVQAVFERASVRSSSNWMGGDRVDMHTSKELQIIHGLAKAEQIQEYMDALVKAIGMVGARFLRSVLCEGKTFAQLAADRGRSNEAGRSAAAAQFRHLLEDLANEWAARGQRA